MCPRWPEKDRRKPSVGSCPVLPAMPGRGLPGSQAEENGSRGQCRSPAAWDAVGTSLMVTGGKKALPRLPVESWPCTLAVTVFWVINMDCVTPKGAQCVWAHPLD